MIVEVTPNAFAYIALLAFFPATLALFHYLRPSLALSLSVVLGVALLPELVALADLPMLPEADKVFTISFSVSVASAIYCRRALWRELRSRPVLLLAAAVVVTTVGTYVTNRDPQVFGPLVLPGLTERDVPSMIVRDAFMMYIPFFLAYVLIRTPEALKDLLWTVLVVALFYAPLALFEVRMSPRFHSWVYGFHQQGFLMSVRGSLYRPFVFMRHGLALSLFFSTALAFAAALARARLPVLRASAWAWTGFMALVLVLSRSLGAALFGAVSLLVLATTKGNLARRLALGLAAVALLFPILRATDVFPTEALVSTAERHSAERAESLAFRFQNEDILVERALQRPLFGWGGFGRSRVYSDEGRDVSITDGFWVIRLGATGAAGFLLAFGLICAPVALAYRRLPSVRHPRVRILVEALTLVLAIRAVDLLPNGLFSPLTLFFAGALAGVVRAPPRADDAPAK